MMNIPDIATSFDLDRVRRDHHEFWGELIVRCGLAGAKTVDGILSAADFNLSSQQSRTTRAKYLQERANTNGQVEWISLTEEFCQRVIAFDREGQDAPRLKDITCPERGDQGWTVDGITMLERHPMVLFGDGGQGKSLVALYLVGKLAKRGLRVLYCDWEFDGESHRERYWQLFGENMPETLRYARCDKPMTMEADRLRRLVQTYDIQYLVCDSIVFACGAGVPAESAEAASNYYQALRQIGVGSLNLAHTTKSANQDDDKKKIQASKPFGSVFWSNGARSTWFVEADNETPGKFAVSLTQKKANTGPLRPPVAWDIDFSEDAITFTPSNVADNDKFVKNLFVWQRMVKELQTKGEPMTQKELSDQLGKHLTNIGKEVNKKDGRFVKVTGPDGIERVALRTDQTTH